MGILTPVRPGDNAPGGYDRGMILLTPGPTPVPERVRAAMAAPMVPHRGRVFSELLARVRPLLSDLFATQGPVLAFAGSGTSAMESALWSLATPGAETVSVSSGRFGERWGRSLDRIAAVVGGAHRRVHNPWGKPADLAALAEAIGPATALVTVVQSETSTGALTDLRAVARTVRAHAPGALVVADVVTGVGAIELEMDAWDLDVCVAASQKALMLPPGMGLVALGPRAVGRLEATEPIAAASGDLRWRLEAFAKGTVANTPPIAHWYGLAESLEMIFEEGLGARRRRVSALAERVRAELTEAGFTLAAREPTDSVSAVFFPEGVGDELLEACRARGVEFSGGQDAWAGRVLRFSHMGAVDEPMTEAGLTAIRESLP